MFKYGEDQVLQQAFDYIASTYGGHYADGQEQGVQLFDYWQSLGILQPVAAGTAMKYLARFGKKDGHNKKDLLKAIHYTILLWYATFGNEPVDAPDEMDDRDDPELVPETDRLDIESVLNELFSRGRNGQTTPSWLALTDNT